ncbi:MAG: cytochrome c3 family protein [Planctomycetes bacterium]|nr:cytochrome c3 family protein [Planctomycetota bacterium]
MRNRGTAWEAGALCVVLAARALGGMAGSAHDFTASGWSRGAGCGVCHAFHSTDAPAAGTPAWSREFSNVAYTLYTSTTLDATPGQPTHYGSKLCLSCHDGVTALDTFGGQRGSTYIHGKARIGTDLRATHPIGIIYDGALAHADRGLFDPNTKRIPTGETITNGLLFGTGNLECASCHDVHDRLGNPKLLRIRNNGSALCRTCHRM